MTGPRSPFEDFLRASAYRQDETHRIWHKEGEAAFSYSDGDETEQRIARVVADSADVSQFSRELHRHMTDWPSTYHLSPTRANLLRPLAGAIANAKVLEIGAGCGAITRFLGEQGAQVLALEGSRRRASIAASRCRDLPNVAVLNERFDALRTSQRFDVVTLIGVLEYARMYTAGADPVLETLRLARELLTDDGILVVAIENQLGLKYFAGVAEDHLGRAMAGIQDQYGEHTVVTFGKVELESYFRKAGFEASECAVPLPDYKLPQCVVFPLGVAAHEEFDAGSLAGQSSRSDRQLVTMPLFSLGRAFDVVGRNGLLADLANSFLMIARKSGQSPSFSTLLPDVLAEQYSSARAPAFAKTSRFVRKQGSIVVQHHKLSPDALPDSKLLVQSLEEEPYFHGMHWGDALEGIVTKPDWTIAQVGAWFDVWKRALAARLPEAPKADSLALETAIPGALVDAVPRNLVRHVDGTTTFFDLEWSFKAPLTFGYLAFRAIKLSFGSLTGVTAPHDPRMLHVPTLIRAILREHGLVVTSSHIQTYLDLEASLRDESIGDFGAPLEYDAYKSDHLGVLPDVSNLLRQNSASQTQLVELESMHAALDREHEQVKGAYAKLQESHRQLQLDVTRLNDETTRLNDETTRLHDVLDSSSGDKRAADEKLQDRIHGLEARIVKLVHFEQVAKSQASELELITRSASWSLTRPLRAGNAWVRRMKSAAGRRLATATKKAYRTVPVSPGTKNALKSAIFNRTGLLFRHTGAYQRWLAYERTHAPETQSRGAANSAVYSDSTTDLPANVLWRADGTREWADYDVVRHRIEATLQEQQQAKKPQKFSVRDFSSLGVDEAAKRIRLPAAPASPDVTILVPVYNHLTTTLECLASIADHASAAGASFEVLIADDASTDESHRVLAAIPHVRVVTQPSNLGFLRNCNAAAAQAKGRLIVLLNNDVQVTEGWLEALVACMDRSADVGAVGPRIAYPTGWLQEAGTTLHADGTSEMVGLNDLPDQPRYSFERDVDYCSGACLLIRAEDFRRLGGFDEMYAPAYCEDSDLCMRLRAEGRRIVYCPEATVVHHLSRTSDGLASDYKLRCISTNLAKFTSKWSNELERMDDVRTIAFYLPQFHPFPENDLWWGPGFTEWTNVTKAKPNYVGHYQPRVPADLGYYDLRVTETMEKQAEMARRYGLGGFCYYYYWFAGHRLLERPIENMLLTGRPDFPFCLCWANENWTRRWDGQEHDVLMAQKHSDDDDVAVIRDLMRYFRSPNYIRINGKPLILVYRITLFPDFARTSAIWRQVCRDEGIGEIYITQVESFELASAGIPPSQLGCDAAVEFPPQGMAQPYPVKAPLLNPDFQGAVADYRDIAVRYATRELPAYKRFMGTMPGWDNTARRQNNSYSFEHATPGAFQAWLETAIARTKQQYTGDERLVFINAWNEWAEGAYLEPDRRFGHTYLEAVQNALTSDRLIRKARYSLG
ncbi:glycoside hydrolase family 99-like domain-containing protein [Dyella japonica]|uniref:glycoside hydrolase family 99-like domain-containing protein n=1 Tax=Dyella japonica TaxID=231455 RepID=UPI0009E43683|nr:glycoside hydrolase family 99-like domain-containing protein [Dyella japonica]